MFGLQQYKYLIQQRLSRPPTILIRKIINISSRPVLIHLFRGQRSVVPNRATIWKLIERRIKRTNSKLFFMKLGLERKKINIYLQLVQKNSRKSFRILDQTIFAHYHRPTGGKELAHNIFVSGPISWILNQFPGFWTNFLDSLVTSRERLKSIRSIVSKSDNEIE